MKKKEMMSPWGKIVAIVIMIALFFILSGILMGAWNFVIPELIRSINGTAPTWSNISYTTAMVFMILIVIIVDPGLIATAVWKSCIYLFDGVEDATYKKRKESVAYNVQPVVNTWGKQTNY